MKRKREVLYIEAPVTGDENKIWTTDEPASLTRSVSPPPILSRRKSNQPKSLIAQVEAGEKDVEDHLSFFSSKLLSVSRLHVSNTPRLDHQSWIDLYTSNTGRSDGHHFVIHQHDHPIAGTHYDLRLQCNETSSVSWAIMYGMPGDPNSRTLNRNATETRIHCLWNHLIETASNQTGTILIWDTGSYEILPYRHDLMQSNDATTDEDGQSSGNDNFFVDPEWNSLSEPQKLHKSFQSRRIRLRLHGTRLPQGYTLSLWLRSENDRADQPAAPKTRRRRGPHSMSKKSGDRTADASNSDRDRPSDSEAAITFARRIRRDVSSLHRKESPPVKREHNPQTTSSTLRSSSQVQSLTNSALSPISCKTEIEPDHKPALDEEERIRLNNAYTGANNTINSVHQRRWFLCLDRTNSGFTRNTKKGKWVNVANLSHDIRVKTGTNSHGSSSVATTNKLQHTTTTTNSSEQQHTTTRQLPSLPTFPSPTPAPAPPDHAIRLGANPDSTPTLSATSQATLPATIHATPNTSLVENRRYSYPFYVLGRDHERSIVTGRLAREILDDEGVVGFVPRGKWRPVVE